MVGYVVADTFDIADISDKMGLLFHQHVNRRLYSSTQFIRKGSRLRHDTTEELDFVSEFAQKRQVWSSTPSIPEGLVQFHWVVEQDSTFCDQIFCFAHWGDSWLV
jgi:hypothetical protein